MALVATMVHLEPKQKSKLQTLAKRKGSSLASEVRKAVNVQLLTSLHTKAEIEQIDLITKEAQKSIKRMCDTVDRMIQKLDEGLINIEKMRAARPC